MPVPAWMMKVEPTEQATTKAKLEQKAEGTREKKQKSVKHVRHRARLPREENERKKYDLPGWVKDNGFKTMLMMMLKTLANTQQRLRTLESVVADNYVVHTDFGSNGATPVPVAVAQAEAYHKKAITAPDHDMGAPAPQVLYAFCESLIQCDVGIGPRQEVQTQILDKLSALDPERATDAVSVFNVRPCYDNSYHKIIMVSQDIQVRAAVKKAILSQTGVKHYTAPAPASGQEDEIQKWIEKLESLD